MADLDHPDHQLVIRDCIHDPVHTLPKPVLLTTAELLARTRAGNIGQGLDPGDDPSPLSLLRNRFDLACC
jgi:hypothetical protein